MCFHSLLAQVGVIILAMLPVQWGPSPKESCSPALMREAHGHAGAAAADAQQHGLASGTL